MTTTYHIRDENGQLVAIAGDIDEIPALVAGDLSLTVTQVIKSGTWSLELPLMKEER
jgi:hypothetical protein